MFESDNAMGRSRGPGLTALPGWGRRLASRAGAALTAIAMLVALLAPSPSLAVAEQGTPFERVDEVDSVAIDLAVWFDADTREMLGGDAAVEAWTAIAVNNTNIALAASGLAVHLRVVHLAYSADLDRVLQQRVTRLAEANADTLMLLAGTEEQLSGFKCGLAGVWVRATEPDCILTFAHELGHQLLADHCPGDDDVDPLLDPRRFLAQDWGTHMTLMCKGGASSQDADRAKRVLLFSDGNAEIMAEQIDRVALAAPAVAAAWSQGCFSYAGSSRMITCDASAMVQEAEGSPRAVNEAADEPGQFVTREDLIAVPGQPGRTMAGASGGYFVQSQLAGDMVEFQFDVPTGGLYTLSARALSRNGSVASVDVVAAGTERRWQLPAGPNWQYQDVITAEFAAGINTVTMRAVDSGAGIDRVQLAPATGIADGDLVRRSRVRQLIDAFEAVGAATGSYVVEGGWQDSGNGAVYQSNLTDYRFGTIAAQLARYDTRVDLTPPTLSGRWEFVSIRCADRVIVFSRGESIAPTESDVTWVRANACRTWPIDQGRTYFEVTDPLGGADPAVPADTDAIRMTRVSELLGAFEAYRYQTGTYVIGGGYRDRGTGAVYVAGSGEYGDVSIAEALIDAGFEINATHPPQLDKGEIVAIRCQDRLAVFSRSDGIEPTAFDANWWSENGCSTSALENGRAYFELGSPGPD